MTCTESILAAGLELALIHSQNGRYEKKKYQISPNKHAMHHYRESNDLYVCIRYL